MNALSGTQQHALDALVETAASDLIIGIGPFIAGIVVTIVLILAVRLGINWRASEPPPPTPEEQPHAPSLRTHVEEIREADEEAFPADGHRLMPYELKQYGSHGVEPPEKGVPEKDQNKGGGFGSGGVGG
ncbi:DUF6479 family protein [Streptomyces sp. NPDC052236]|uniref:DUF6479 family protein n=1 Tax=Streptomyces sp. NPDC052236 TaxID=3365686 RepID=UPI0037D6A621